MLAIVMVKKLSMNLAYAWGSNACGQLGQGPSGEVKICSPRPLTGQFGQANVDQVACGAFHSALLKAARVTDEKGITFKVTSCVRKLIL